MKKILSELAMMLTMSALVFATETTLTEDNLAMQEVDSETVTFCMKSSIDDSPIVGANVVVGEVCEDLNNLEGCQGADADESSAGGKFDVTMLDAVTGADGCADAQLDTNMAP